jgi:hypothetical protein
MPLRDDNDMQPGPTGTVHNSAEFKQPMLGLIRQTNSTVNILAFGDVEGHSPSYLCVDSGGESTWQSFRDVQIIDPRVVPPSRDQLQRTYQSTTEKVTGSSR